MFGILCKKGQKIVNRGEWQVRAGRKGSMACSDLGSGLGSGSESGSGSCSDLRGRVRFGF